MRDRCKIVLNSVQWLALAPNQPGTSPHTRRCRRELLNSQISVICDRLPKRWQTQSPRLVSTSRARTLYSQGEYRHCGPVTVPPSMPLLTILGWGESTGSAASAGRGGGRGTAASAGRGEYMDIAGCTRAPNAALLSQQCLLPYHKRCPLGNLARASLSVMQVGEP